MIILLRSMVFGLLLIASTLFRAEAATVVPERILGNANAPVTVEEFVSLTCSHCAQFYNTILPDLENKYVLNGKVRFILRDFPLDGVSLKLASLARCMPEDEYYPFIKTLYKNQKQWLGNPDFDKIVIQYARLGGLNEAKAKACIQDENMMDAIVAGRTAAGEKYKIEATPTFVINDGAETLKGALPVDAFAKAFDKLLKNKN